MEDYLFRCSMDGRWQRYAIRRIEINSEMAIQYRSFLPLAVDKLFRAWVLKKSGERDNWIPRRAGVLRSARNRGG
jgi:hypothetical protein